VLIRKLVRCFTVSVGTTIMSAIIIIVLAVGFGVPGAVANVVAVLCATGPSYFFNRRWVWGRREHSSYLRQIAPFWALSISGLVLSTLAVAAADSLTAGLHPSVRAIALPLANLSAYGALWIVQFALLDRVIFRDRAVAAPHAGARSRSAGRAAA
jgi:putative flippase GtrA